ncbi:hypothetical protein M408DRAFT_332891 [Serendipita vermifera MAFF 305830]|uniref:Uncharacterized protein n=1 Tax=Serendipita vermifera MAFF 305830 TaxID=933852 RepID=A0A0C3ACZ0_SERVB|nr:hypothetical protein M408DRAFT_332891 [Serendipita vermifera MAFF 305830]
MSKILIVDDADAGINYSDGWTVGNSVADSSKEYNSTVHRSDAAGQELSYIFFGTQITVYGTLDTPGTNGPPSATFSIDGATPVAFNSTGTVHPDNPAIVTSHLILYQSPGLTKAQHTITIKTGTPANAAAHFYFDFFTVATGADSASGSIIVDDRDPSISYVGTWEDQGVTDEYLHTTRQAPDLGGGSATFRFNGTAATVFGTTGPTSSAATAVLVDFSLDGVPSSSFAGPEVANPIKHHAMFHVEGLSSDREHTIEMVGRNSNDWFLDYIVYQTKNSAIPGGGGGDGGNNGSDGGANKTNAGVIAGAVVAAVVGIGAIAAIIFMLLRRRRAKQGNPGPRLQEQPATGQVETSPFIPPAQPGITPFTSYSGLPTTPDYHMTPFSTPGVIPSSKETRANASVTGPVNPAPASVYSGIMSSGYGDTSLGDSESTVPTSPGQHSAYLQPQPLPSQSHGHIVYSHNNPLYPQFDAASSRGAPAHRVTHSGDYNQTSPASSSEKAQFTHTRMSPVPPTHVPAPPLSPLSPLSPAVEEDSGIRLPRTSPPMYTRD